MKTSLRHFGITLLIPVLLLAEPVKNATHKLFAGIEQTKPEEITQAIKEGANLTTELEWGEKKEKVSALELATQNYSPFTYQKQQQIIHALIDKGASVTKSGKNLWDISKNELTTEAKNYFESKKGNATSGRI